MKTTIKTIAIASIMQIASLTISAQNPTQKQKLCMASVDVTGMKIDQDQMSNLIRIEVEKLDTFEVLNKYDVEVGLKNSNILINSCFSKDCLIKAGNAVKSDKVLTGAIDVFPTKIIYTLRLLDLKTNNVEKTTVVEFLNIPEEIETFTKIIVLKMFNKSYDKNTYQKLTNPYDFDNLKNNPQYERLRADGPRVGFTYYTGNIASILEADKSVGGFEAAPVMFQFGYQFEKQYLNEGKIQGLFEFIPMITGVDQGYFIPSFTLLHGLRSNKSGWEFAIGPTIGLALKSKGYYDNENIWRQESYWTNDTLNKGVKNPFTVKERLDSRGDYTVNTGFVIAIGKTFKSGKLNIPVNMYCIPSKDSMRFGASFGFNGNKRKGSK